MDAYRHKHFIFPARHSPARSLVEIFTQTAVPRDQTASSLVLKRNPSPTRHIAGKTSISYSVFIDAKVTSDQSQNMVSSIQNRKGTSTSKRTVIFVIMEIVSGTYTV